MNTVNQYSCVVTFFIVPSSDPYTRVSLYDPVSGELTSLQTKTIKKVGIHTVTYVHLQLPLHFILGTANDSRSLSFLIAILNLLPEDVGPKVE